MKNKKRLSIWQLAADWSNSPENREEVVFVEFCRRLKNETRFFCQHDFLDVFKDSFPKFSVPVKTDDEIYRARRFPNNYRILDHRCSTPPFLGFSKTDSFVPESAKITDTRANTRGIPCLYAAKSIDTAISEVRPYKGSHVSVAKIKINRPLKLFNFSFSEADLKLDADDFHAKFPPWYISLSVMFSIPCENNENGEYLLTQCISEYLRLYGDFDGIVFPSSLHDKGENVVLFNCKYNTYDICEPISSSVYKITDIDVKYEQTL